MTNPSTMRYLFTILASVILVGSTACESGPDPTMAPTAIRIQQPPLSPLSEGVSREAEVVRVIDGDTIDVRFADGTTDRVRLLGVDTPETFSTNNSFEYGTITDTACLDSWGDHATEFVALALEGQTVTLAADPAAGERGSFGRLLRYVHHKGDDFNAVLVESGFARAYTEAESSRLAEYVALEAQARSLGLGLWRCDAGAATSGAGAPSVTCDPAYPDVCIPPPPPDLNCADIPHRRFTVHSPDPHRFDGDSDGIGCEM